MEINLCQVCVFLAPPRGQQCASPRGAGVSQSSPVRMWDSGNPSTYLSISLACGSACIKCISRSAASRPAVRDPARRWRFSMRPWQKAACDQSTFKCRYASIYLQRSTYIECICLSNAFRPAVREPARRWRFSIKPWR